jgi:hypothetical protein
MTFMFCKTQRYLHNLANEVIKTRRTKRLKKVFITSGIAVFLLMVIIAVNFSGIGAISSVEARSIQPNFNNGLGGSNTVAEDAHALAAQLYSNRNEADVYYKQLLTAYSESVDRDFVILFNSGGWGTNVLQNSADWTSIIDGVKYSLQTSGFRVTALNYQRTPDSFPGKLNELKEIFTGYKDKANHLAQLAAFITNHLPDVKVILAGESTGTVICDETMDLLKNNDRVYSIQTGSPPWHSRVIGVRTLSVNDNGIVPDSFSEGDLATIFKYSFIALVEFKKPDVKGEILGFLSAPGHEYWWQDPGVSPQIETFLSKYFSTIPETQSRKIKGG